MTEQAPAVEAQESDTSVAAPEINTPELATATVDSVCGVEATSNIVLPVVGMTGDNAPVVVSQLGDVKEMTDDTMQPVASQVDGDADDMVLGDIVKEVPRRRTRKSHSVTFSAHASTRRSTRLSTAGRSLCNCYIFFIYCLAVLQCCVHTYHTSNMRQLSIFPSNTLGMTILVRSALFSLFS